MFRTTNRLRASTLATVLVVLAAACSSSGEDTAGSTAEASEVAVETSDSTSDTDDDHQHGDDTHTHEGDDHDDGSEVSFAGELTGSYTLADEEFGTMVTVTVDGDTRTIETNALPDHETGEFPNSGNPNAISAQDVTWSFPIDPTAGGTATEVRVTGVAVNGVKFEPGTAETASCATGETYRIEGLQDTFTLGMDENNAHVQPTGEYHYHGIADVLVESRAGDDDLVLIGFAVDGHLIYHSQSEAYASSYQLETTDRTGTDCTISGPSGQVIDLEGTTPDGTYDADWTFVEGSGDLDECNGTEIDGRYVYIVTDAYPFIGRCVMGEASADAGGGGGGPGSGAAPGQDGGDNAAPPDAPDFSEAASALGVSEQELIDALGFPPDVDTAAATLGISVDELVAILPPPPSR